MSSDNSIEKYINLIKISQNTTNAVEKNKIADLLILDANPLKDINNTQKIHALIRKGVYMNRAILDSLLSAVAQQVAKKEAAEKK